jgi:hypothetical protein
MDDIFDAIPVPHNRAGLGNLSVDGGDAGLERVSLQGDNKPQRLSSAPTTKARARLKENTTHNTRSSDPGIQWRQFRVSPG